VQRYDLRYSTQPELVLETLAKNENGDKEIEAFHPPCRPYCYVKTASDVSTDRKRYLSALIQSVTDNDCRVRRDETHRHVNGDFELWKVTAGIPWDIRDFKHGFEYETFEADIPYARRVMIDEGIQADVPEPEDILYFDIEVDPRGEFPDPEEATKQILSIAWTDGAGSEGFICYDDEERVLREFFDLLDDYFVLAGWNSETFDWMYVLNRKQIYDIYYDEFEIVHLDLQYLFMHVNREERQSFALDAVGEDEVDMTKTMSEEDHEMGYEVLWHWFQTDRETLEEYNVEDARITAAIDEKYRLTRIVFRICRRGYTRPSTLMYNTDSGQVNMAVGKACDGAILNHNDESFNDKGKYRDLHDFPGGRVFKPIPGTYSDVMTADFSGMYPAIIRDFNVGVKSWLDTNDITEAVETANQRFDEDVTKTDIITGIGPEPEDAYETTGQLDNVGKARGYFVKPGIVESEIAGSLDGIESLRKEFKSLKKQASKGSTEWHRRNNQDRGLKVLANSMFGVAASPVHRYYEPGMSENITEIGQHLTSACKLWAEENLEEVEKVVYGDTDSVQFELVVENTDVDMDGFDEYVADFVDEVGPDNELDLDISDLEECYRARRVAQRTASKLNDFVVTYVRDVFNSPGDHMEMDLDDVWKRYHITDRKKKYAGDVVYDDGPCAYRKIKGFKCVKANTSDAIVDFQEDLIDAKLSGDDTTGIVREYKDKLFTGRFDEQMVQHTRLNQMPDEYETIMAHARAAKKIIEREGDRGAVRTGDKVAYLKRGSDKSQVEPVDNGITDKRPNEGYCYKCSHVVGKPHDHETDENPKLRVPEYSYLWKNRFKPTMDLLQVERFEQTSIAAFT